jgi:hypothetical protein
VTVEPASLGSHLLLWARKVGRRGEPPGTQRQVGEEECISMSDASLNLNTVFKVCFNVLSGINRYFIEKYFLIKSVWKSSG